MPQTSRFFRVATEGPTVDGRAISRAQIEEMAETYSLETYGARIWMEHLRGLFPDSEFQAHGDVVAVKTQENENGELQLLAQIQPLPKLVEMNQKGQKVYSSIEIHPNFRSTGKAYLMGLAVTDSPASVGVEMLKFTQQHPALKDTNLNLNLISQPTETNFTMSDQTPKQDKNTEEGLLSKFTALFAKKEDIEAEKQQQSENLSDVEKTLELFANQIKNKASTEEFSNLKTQLENLTASFNDLKKTLEENPESNYSQRPDAQGGSDSGYAKTDC